MSDIKFQVTTQEKYDAMDKNSGYFYLTSTEDGIYNVYLGKSKLSNGAEIETLKEKINELEERVSNLEK